MKHIFCICPEDKLFDDIFLLRSTTSDSNFSYISLLKIEQYCKSQGIEIVGKIPYDTIVTEAMIHEKSVIEFSDGEVANSIIKTWNAIKKRLSL